MARHWRASPSRSFCLLVSVLLSAQVLLHGPIAQMPTAASASGGRPIADRG